MKRLTRWGVLGGMLLAGSGAAQAQLAAVKTNALLWGNLTPNLSVELVTAPRFSLEGTVFYGLNKNPLDVQLKGAQAEIRYTHRGDAAGPGLTYGYAWPLCKHFNLEFSAGVGVMWYREKKYAEGTNLNKAEYNAKGMKYVPTEVAVTCSYVF